MPAHAVEDDATTFSSCVVIVAANHWDGVRMADRQLAEALTAHAPVLYVDPPVSAVSLYRAGGLRPGALRPRLTRLGPRLARLSPVVLPGITWAATAAANRTLLARQVRAATRRLGGRPAALVETSQLTPVLGRCGERVRVYWAQDDFVGGAELLGLPAGRVRRGEQRLLTVADVVVAANPLVQQTLAAAGHESVLVPYGCDADHFGTAARTEPAAVDLPAGPVVGFMGHLGDRIDPDLFTAVVELGHPVLVVGPAHARSAPAALAGPMSRPNVTWVGEQPFEDLPAWLARMTVGVLPYNHSPFNEGSFPLKMLEYLAAGLPVVASDLPAVRWLASPHIHVADTPEAFAAGVRAALAEQRTGPADAARREFAAGHTWAARAAAFAAAIGLGPAGGQPPVRPASDRPATG